MSVRDIVAHAPFSPGDGNIYLGSKQSHLFAIDPATGTVYNCHTSTASNQSVDCNGEVCALQVSVMFRCSFFMPVAKWSSISW